MPDFFKREVGPFPVGVWLVIIVVGAGAGIVINRSIGSTDEEEVVLEPEAGRDPFSAGVGVPRPAYSGATLLSPAPPSTSADTTPPTSNDEWLRRAVKAVTGGEGAPLPLAALTALQGYLDGLPLDADQQAIVNKAIGALGPPPTGAPVLVPAPAPGSPVERPRVPGSGVIWNRNPEPIGREPISSDRDRIAGRTPITDGDRTWTVGRGPGGTLVYLDGSGRTLTAGR